MTKEEEQMIESRLMEMTKHWTEEDFKEQAKAMKNITNLSKWDIVYQALKWAMIEARASVVKLLTEKERKKWFDETIHNITRIEELTKKPMQVASASPLEAIGEKSVSVFTTNDKLRYHILEGQKDLDLTLRGQPRRDSVMGVTRVYLKDNKWEIDGDYLWPHVVSSSNVECQVEGAVKNIKELWIHSKSKGWITIPIERNNFVECEHTAINTRYQSHSPHLETPTDITDVFVK